MNAIARLLERATSAEAWPQGAHVELVIEGRLFGRGRVAFVEGGWIYWAAEDGRVHASRADALRRIPLYALSPRPVVFHGQSTCTCCW